MTTAELQAQISAMRESIKAQQERLDALEKWLDNEVPDVLEWNIKYREEGWCMDYSGGVYPANSYLSASGIRKRRIFKTEKYARMYAMKTQYIADLLHFKWLYDRDYEPDWAHAQWTIRNLDGKYVPVLSAWEQDNDIYFSTKEIAQKCADWFNRKAGII